MIRMTSFLVTISALALWAIPPADAAEMTFSQEFNACMDKSNGNTPDMIDCMTNETGIWDKRLNMSYKKLMSSLPNPRQTELKATQILWLKFREANCGFYLDPDGGSIAKVNANSCTLDMTATRALELAKFLE